MSRSFQLPKDCLLHLPGYRANLKPPNLSQNVKPTRESTQMSQKVPFENDRCARPRK